MDPRARRAAVPRAGRHASARRFARRSTSSSRRRWAASSPAMRWRRALGVEAMFVERPSGSSSCAAVSSSRPAQRVLMVEDVVTTGLSSRESDRGDRRRRRRGDRARPAWSTVRAARADLGVPLLPAVRLDVPTYPPTRCRPSSRRSRRSKPGSRAAARRADASASASTSTTSRRSGTRAAATIPIRSAPPSPRPRPAPTASPPICARTGATSPTTISTALMAELEHPAEPRNGGDRGDARDRARATARTPPASSPRSARSAPPRAGSTPPASTIISLIMSTRLRDAGIRVSLFIEPDPRQIEAAIRLGAPVVEFHTGRYAHLRGRGPRPPSCAGSPTPPRSRSRTASSPMPATASTFDNVAPVAAIPQLAELNIGHFLVGEAIFIGLDASVRCAPDGRGAVSHAPLTAHGR